MFKTAVFGRVMHTFTFISFNNGALGESELARRVERCQVTAAPPEARESRVRPVLTDALPA